MNSNNPELAIFKGKGFILADTNQRATEYLQDPVHDIDFPIYYIGPIKDTISISRRYWRGRTPVKFWPEKFAAGRIYSDMNLRIEVDTTLAVNSPVEYIHKDGKLKLDSTRNYYASVFTIRNISDSIVWMGRTFSVYFLHRELKDKPGHWVRVGENISDIGICATHEPEIFLKPGEIILSKVRHYKGPFVTDCRLVFGKNNHLVYSNIFKESVDERIFQNASKNYVNE
ncbi:hypothetical protein GO495_31035 [Chitinophaga oryziterrae]|uniref:Uncharacterized protein n=1 Tax=Chitinophaga oryziterrae TaxID=1031224 RepID=A0A6N8JIG5_9BACT|nr:hypothetical protein [Chitinophaga oryziterrae]MVT45063.1 hypothetical protein [Chitinophaga oryziterrae]